MSDDDLERTVAAFLEDAERAYDEYEQGYADADATLRVLRSHLDQLASEVE